MSKLTKEDSLEIEDIIYGFEHYAELEPNKKRIATLRRNKGTDKIIEEMREIWVLGHGVLSNQKRINALKKLLEE